MRIGHPLHVLASLWLASTAWAQAPFDVDTTFHTSITQQYVNSLTVLPDGKLLLSGQIRFPGSLNDLGSARLLQNGQRDPSFGDFTGGGKLTSWSNGFYVGVGQTVKRLLPTGYLDPSFIGMNLGPYFSSLQGGDYHVYSDGRLVVSGAHILDDTARGFDGIYNLIWFSNTGYLDTTRIHRKGNGTLWFFEELPDGNFICHCSCSQFDGTPVDRIFRTDAAGVPDTTFHTGVSSGQAFDYYALPDGRIYVGGTFALNTAPAQTLELVRFMPDGSLDPTFNNVLQFGGEGLSGLPKVNRIVPFGLDKFFVVGHFRSVNGEPRGGICVVDSTGQLLPYFDDCGAGLFTYMGLTAGSIGGILPTSDSLYYYIWGRYTGYNDGTVNDAQQRFVTRLHVGDFTTGAAPLTLGVGPGVRVYPNPSSGSATLQLEQVPRNAMLVLRDALGREVQRMRVSGHYTTFALPSASGVYMVELWGNGERLATQRLVVE